MSTNVLSKIEAVELRRLRMPLTKPFRTAFGVQAQRDLLLIRVITAEGYGWGECLATEQPFYTSEYTDAAEHVLRNHLLPLLFSAPECRAAELQDVLAGVKGHPIAKAAIEAAVLDAETRAAGMRLADYLGSVKDRIPVGVSVGLADHIEALVEEVEQVVAQGYERVKLKIEPGWDVAPVAAVRERFPELPLQVDANASYRIDDAPQLANLLRLDDYGLLLIEQPFPADDLLAHAEFASRARTPVCLDESITSANATLSAINLGAVGVINIKPARVGGYLEARRIHDLAQARGIPVWCGGMLETGIGRAGNLALAGLPGFSLPGDISASDRYFETDLTTPFVLDDGHLTIPDGPGIGVEPDEAVLDELSTSCELVRAEP